MSPEPRRAPVAPLREPVVTPTPPAQAANGAGGEATANATPLNGAEPNATAKIAADGHAHPASPGVTTRAMDGAADGAPSNEEFTGPNPTDAHGLLRDGSAMSAEDRARTAETAASLKTAQSEPFTIGRRGRVASGASMLTAFWVLSREGVISTFPVEGAPGPVRLIHAIARRLERKDVGDRPARLTRALHRLGPSWVKLGQFLATRPDVVGPDLALDLETLQDRMMPFDEADARARFEATTERRIETEFSDFSRPIAAASVAQVHRATRRRPREGQSADVAVKVVRPGVRRAFARDLGTFYAIARLMERWVPGTQRLKPVAITDMLAASARLEMDLRLEAAAFSELAENTRNDPGFRLPAIHWDLTGRDALVMDWVEGIKLNNVAGLKAAGLDRRVLAVNLMQSFLRHTLRDGFFHADMHPGNLFAAPDGAVVAVDMGIVGRLDPANRRYLAEILYGFIRRDYARVAEVHFEAGWVPADRDVDVFAQAIRAVGEPIHGQRANEVSMGNVLTLLFEITDLFGMQARPELILLQKTMVVVEGISRTLDPEFDMWAASEPIVRGWIVRNLGPAGAAKDLKAGFDAGRRLLREAPTLAARLERLSEDVARQADGGLRLAPETAREIGRSMARAQRGTSVALWIIAACAVAGVAALM